MRRRWGRRPTIIRAGDKVVIEVPSGMTAEHVDAISAALVREFGEDVIVLVGASVKAVRRQ